MRIGVIALQGNVEEHIDALSRVFDGEVVKIYVENGQPVQYGERLFAIKAS